MKNHLEQLEAEIRRILLHVGKKLYRLYNLVVAYKDLGVKRFETENILRK